MQPSDSGIKVMKLPGYTGMDYVNIASFAFPVVEYIREYKPDCIVAFDRGARLFSLAIFDLYRQLYGRLPTYDGKIHIRPVSADHPQGRMIDHMFPLIEDVTKNGGKKLLLLDELIHMGEVQGIARKIINGLNPDLEIKVVVGSQYNHYTCGEEYEHYHPDRISLVARPDVVGEAEWNDHIELIGVLYDDLLMPHLKTSASSRSYRNKMLQSIDDFVKTRKLQDAIAVEV